MISLLEKKITLRYLRPKKKEGFLKTISIFSFTGISLGVAILIIVMSVMNGFKNELIDKILGFSPHIVVKPYLEKINQEDIKNINKKNDEIEKILFSLNGEAVVIGNEITKGVIIRGYLKKEIKNIDLIKDNIIDGNLNDFEKNTVLIGKDLAMSLNLVVNDDINLMTASNITTPFGAIPKQENYKISSIFSSGLAEFDNNIIFMPFDDLKTLFDLSPDDFFLEIYLNNPEKADKIKNDIQKAFPKFYIYSWADLNKSFFGALKVERNVMFIILTLIIIVAAFNIISGLTILVKNKTKEIALLRTFGVKKKSIIKIFFFTGFFIGFLATITGTIIGILFSLYVEEIRTLISSLFNLNLFPEEIYFLSKIPSEINYKFILIIFTFSMTITTLASIIPSLKIAKLDPIKSLKYE